MKRTANVLLVPLALALITVSTATAASSRSTDIPACEELLSKHEAALTMHRQTAEIVSRAVVGSSRTCTYAAFGKTEIEKSLELEWGPYGDRRAMAAPFATKYLCPVSKAACRAFKTAATLKADTASFAGTEKALAEVGTTKWLHDSGFDGNLTFMWLPSSRMSPIDEMAFVAVYVAKSKHTLQVGCTDNHSGKADAQCARRAAMWAYDSVP